MKRRGSNSCEIEERLARAVERSSETNSISPVLREELRLSILHRRHAHGLDDLQVEFKEPEQHELTPYEKEKKLRRREQNRRAARRCREKKKMRQDGTVMSLARMVEENKTLEAEINLLKSQKEAIRGYLVTHELCVKEEDCEPPSCDSSVLPQSQFNALSPGFDSTSPYSQNSPYSQQGSPLDPIGQLGNDVMVHETADVLPQSLVEFCLEHSAPEEELFYDNDVRRQVLSVSSVSTDGGDPFGLESDSDTGLYSSADQSGLSEVSEDEDVFQSKTDSNLETLFSANQSCLTLTPFDPLTSQTDGACVETSYIQYLNFAEQ